VNRAVVYIAVGGGVQWTCGYLWQLSSDYLTIGTGLHPFVGGVIATVLIGLCIALCVIEAVD